MKPQDSVGDPDEFLQSLIICAGCFSISIVCAMIAWMKERHVLFSDYSKGRFGISGSWAFHFLWRFSVISCLLEMILASFAIGLEFSWDTTTKAWLPMGLLNSQNDMFFVMIPGILIIWLFWSCFGITLKKRHLPRSFTGNEQILLSGCNRGRSLVSLAHLLDISGHITVCDPWNTAQYPISWRWAEENVKREGVENKISFMLHSTVDLRSIPLPDRSIDLIVLDQVSGVYNLEDWDRIVLELDRILRPSGSIIDIRFMGTRFDTEMKRIGYRINKRSFSFGHFPFLVTIVEWTKLDAEMMTPRVIPSFSERPIEFVEVLDPFDYRKELDPSVLRLGKWILFFEVVLLLCIVFLEFLGWHQLEIPQEIPSGVGTRLSAGFIGPTTIWVGWGFFETYVQMEVMWKRGLISTSKQMAIETLKLNTGYTISNALFQAIFYLPQALGDMYLRKYMSYNYINMAAAGIVLALMVLAWLGYSLRSWTKKIDRKIPDEEEGLLKQDRKSSYTMGDDFCVIGGSLDRSEGSSKHPSFSSIEIIPTPQLFVASLGESQTLSKLTSDDSSDGGVSE